MHKELIQFLSGFISPERYKLFEKNIKNRTRYLTVVLEDIYQSQNASAVLRTCDCFGIQDVHVIENRNTFDINSQVALGSSKWLTINKYNQLKNNSLNAIRQIKEMGYRIIATSPHHNGTLLHDFDIKKGKAAILFGSELPGLSEILLNEADEFLKIPMVGFTESFNISVSAAIILHHLTHKLRNKSNINWELSTTDKQVILLSWLRNSIKNCDLIEKKFNKS